jgi:hypothetical protein
VALALRRQRAALDDVGAVSAEGLLQALLEKLLQDALALPEAARVDLAEALLRMIRRSVSLHPEVETEGREARL